MTPEEKQLLLKDLCARLLYGVKVRLLDGNHIGGITTLNEHILIEIRWYNRIYKPYLRPMSSMSDEEREEWYSYSRTVYDCEFHPEPTVSLMECHLSVDWLNEHHFDYRGLIPMGLALEAPEGMYK